MNFPNYRAAADVAAIGRFLAVAIVATVAFFTDARAAVDVRVEGRPVSGPVEVYVKVTNNGAPVSGLDSDDFAIFEDNVSIPLQPGDLTQPASGGGNQRVSVVFVMDYSGTVQSTALTELQNAVKDFINTAMQNGDEAAIVKFNNTRGVTVVQEFLPIDGAANNAALEQAVDSPYSGTGTPLLDALVVAINQFVTPPHPLPAGPKAIILVSDGGENQSAADEADVYTLANENSIPIFTIGIGDTAQPGRTELLQGLGDETGGLYYAPEPGNDDYIAEAYASIAELLSNEYLITYASALVDCAEHDLRVEVVNEAPVTVQFTRRVCDTEPDAFGFDAQTNVNPGATVTSNTEEINGLTDGVPAHISVVQGSYSIGCNGTFTNDPGTISDGETVCVRHEASNNFNASRTTTLTIGGVAGTFTSTTRQQGNGGGGNGGGGGGSTGLLELLALALVGAWMTARRRVPV